jgi:uncharacterized protein YidB (DUF937 family)
MKLYMTNETKLILIGVGLLSALALFISPIASIITYAQSENRTSALSQAQEKLSPFIEKFRGAGKESGVNMTLPQDGNLTSNLTSLVGSGPFKALSEKFTQISQSLGINTTELKQQIGANLTQLVQKFQDR